MRLLLVLVDGGLGGEVPAAVVAVHGLLEGVHQRDVVQAVLAGGQALAAVLADLRLREEFGD